MGKHRSSSSGRGTFLVVCCLIAIAVVLVLMGSDSSSPPVDPSYTSDPAPVAVAPELPADTWPDDLAPHTGDPSPTPQSATQDAPSSSLPK